VAALAVALLVACGRASAPEAHEVADGMMGDGVEQHSVELLAARVPAVGDAESVAYYGGWYGTPESQRLEAPGPSTQWIHAVVVLYEGEGAELAASTVSVSTDVPEVVDLLTKRLPDCDWVASPELDRHFAGVGWGVEAWLCADVDRVVLVMASM
jgi:hypothetical protein